MNKTDLEVKIESLKKMVLDSQQSTSNYTGELTKVEKQLEDLNKPELTPMVLDAIYEAVEAGVESFDFSDTDNYDKEFSLDYDGRVMLESLDLTDTHGLVEKIVDKVHNLFKEADCPEDDNS